MSSSSSSASSTLRPWDEIAFLNTSQHIHECGYSAPMQEFRMKQNGQKIFSCPFCQYKGKTIAVRPDFQFLEAKKRFLSQFDEKQKKAEENEFQDSLRRFEELQKRRQVLEFYSLAKRGFENENYAEAVEKSSQALRFYCADSKINKELLQLLFSAHQNLMIFYRKRIAAYRKEQKTCKNEAVQRRYKQLVFNNIIIIALAKMQIASLFTEIDLLFSAKTSYEQAILVFNEALYLQQEQSKSNAILHNLAKIHFSLAKISSSKNMFPQVLEHYQKGIELTECILCTQEREENDDSEVQYDLTQAYLDICDLCLPFLQDPKAVSHDAKRLLEMCEVYMKEIDQESLDARQKSQFEMVKLILDLKSFSLRVMKYQE